MFADTIALTAAALVTEASLGYPAPLFRIVGHPVTWIGALIAGLDRRFNNPGSRPGGALALLIVLLAAALPCAALASLPGWPAMALTVLLAATLPAQLSLHTHVAAVAAALRQDLQQARAAVAHIVGRDPDQLDAHAVARAAVESLAENFADGVVGPALYGALLGLPGMALYKAANTADSMIGHRTPRLERFGWAAARFDDLINLPVSRLAALWLVAAAVVLPGARAGAALRAIWRDAGLHRSPNAGWPEAAMAGALGFRLAGPRRYGGVAVEDGWMGDGRAALTAADIGRALVLFRTACGLQIAAIVGLAFMLRG